MTVSLQPDLQTFVDEKIRSGQYADLNTIINHAVAILRDEERLSPDESAELRREVEVGLQQLDRGEGKPLDLQEIRTKARARLGANGD